MIDTANLFVFHERILRNLTVIEINQKLNPFQVPKSKVAAPKSKSYLVGSKHAYEAALQSLCSHKNTKDNISNYKECTVVEVASIDDAIKADKEIAWLVGIKVNLEGQAF